MTRHTLVRFLLTLFWALELLLLENYAADPSAFALSWACLIEVVSSRTTLFACHLISISAVLLLLKRTLVCLFMVHTAVFLTVIIAYGEVYFRPLSWSIIANQYSDLFNVITLDIDWISATSLFVIISGLLFKLLLVLQLPKNPPLSQKTWFRFLTLAILCWSALVVRMIQPFGLIRLTQAVNRIHTIEKHAPSIGYTLAWLLEFLAPQAEQFRHAAVALIDSGESRLIGHEVTFPLPKNIVAIQIESLGWPTLYKNVEKHALLPTLRSIASQSMLYKVKASHHNGSADADFAFLTRRPPSKDIVNYRILNFPYQDSTIETLNRLGYQTTALHNFEGDFFNRRYAFSKMGFSTLLFREELRMLHSLSQHDAPDILDEVLFSTSIDSFQKHSDVQQFQFLITMTSHKPFRAYRPTQSSLFPEPRSITENFLNSIHYVDTKLEAYVEKLPQDTLVLIWGDHQWQRRASYIEKHTSAEHVPFMIFQKGQNLARLQNAQLQPLARSGDLDFLEVVRFVHWVFQTKLAKKAHTLLPGMHARPAHTLSSKARVPYSSEKTN